MTSVGRPTWAEVDLSAIRQNILALKSLLKSPSTRFCAVVKADGYGHGAVAVAAEAQRAGADYLAVSILDEALSLRSAGFTMPILILGPTPAAQAHLVVANSLRQTICNMAQARVLSAAAVSQGLTAKVHLKVDTGMGRLGVPAREAADFASAVAALPNLMTEGIYTHFAKSDSRDKTHAQGQLAAFKTALAAISERGLDIPIKHCANSAAFLDMPETQMDMVRVGIAIYGLWPSEETGRPLKLTPALRFKTRISMLKTVPAGTAISYGCTYITERPATIATLPVGYGDGWLRELSGRIGVLAGGRKVPLVGLICMDQCMADVSGVEELAEGDEVLLFGGPELPAEEVARALGTINYEVVCLLSARVPRIYLGG